MVEIREQWSLVNFFAISVCVLSGEVVVEGKKCCPPNTHLIENSPFCSDNKTRYDLNCKNGALLLNPSVNEHDQFLLKLNETLIEFDGDERLDNEFCLGRILLNDSVVSPYQVALVCFGDDRSDESEVESLVLRALMIVSIFFLLVTLYIYIALPNLRDLPGKCVIAFICSLIAAYVTLLVVQTFPNSSQTACIIQAATLYFFMSSSFFLNNVITFNIWKAVRKVFLNVKEKTWTVLFIFWGFGVPLIMVLISFILENIPGEMHVRPHFGETKCWFRGKVESWSYFHGPISVLLILNTLMFLQSSWTLWKSYRKSTVGSIRSLRFKCMMYLKLFLLMGITWSFEIISYATNNYAYTKYLWFITDCLNSAQGVFIFLILVVFRQKVRLGLLNKKLFGIKWPQSWSKEEVQESSTISFADDVELSIQKMKILDESHK